VTAVTAEPTHPDPEPDDGDFARAVIGLYKRNLSAELQKRPFSGAASREVRQCANGLALMRQLLDDFMRRNTLTGADIEASGVGDAYAIIDHLVTGKAHPIAKHIRGLGAGGIRFARMPPNDFERLTQRIAVGAVRALQWSEAIGLRAATRAIADGLGQRGHDFRPTAGQIRAWHYAFEGDADPGPDTFAGEIIKRSEIRETSPRDEGLRLIIEYTGVAKVV
jgi:hypothetical protein